MSSADRDFKKISLYLLSGLTLLDFLVWVFNQQIALFAALFFLIPLWAVWVWKFIPPEDTDIFPEMEGDKRKDHP
ncbi:MAG TPA: hypothetical protein EYO62_00150 [Aquificales bacterium]|nr:hypothetical protein [Aquificales bacterium]